MTFLKLSKHTCISWQLGGCQDHNMDLPLPSCTSMHTLGKDRPFTLQANLNGMRMMWMTSPPKLLEVCTPLASWMASLIFHSAHLLMRNGTPCQANIGNAYLEGKIKNRSTLFLDPNLVSWNETHSLFSRHSMTSELQASVGMKGLLTASMTWDFNPARQSQCNKMAISMGTLPYM